MPQTRFSERLTLLMKKRKISGRKIGDAIGKSQKTISRYANGDVDPSVETKNLIYKVISDLSGYPEDGLSEQELDQIELDRKIICSFVDGGAEYKLAEEYQQELDYKYKCLSQKFKKLSVGAKKYFLQEFDSFLYVESWEIDVLDFFHELKTQKQIELLRYLECFNLDFEHMKKSNSLPAYLHMISTAKDRPLILYNEESNDDINSNDLDKTFIERLNILYYESNYLPNIECLSFTPYDWYFLSRVCIFEMYDTGETVSWSDSHECLVGERLAQLLDSFK